MLNNKKYLIVVCGPTAVGKTSLAIDLALHYHTEIISADSRQFFKEMNIGTAKPSTEELASAVHHFIGNISINSDYNAGTFENEALSMLSELFKVKNCIILVGGSGLYINALCNGMDEIPKINPEIRIQLNQQFEKEGIEKLLEELKELDPIFYEEVDQHNHIRVIRALEVCKSTLIPFSSFRKKTKKIRDFEVIKIGLNLEREALYAQINHRVDQMLLAGLENEVRSLKEFRHLNALHTVGYSEFFEYFDGNTSYNEAIDLIKQHTRNFAKRQLTWFNKDADIQWFTPYDFEKIVQYINQITEN